MNVTMTLTLLQVCQYCIKTKGTDCQPIWRLWMQKNSGAPVWCVKCRDAGKGCTFKDVKWNVKTWPTIHRTAAGDRRRAINFARRKKTGDANSELPAAITRARSEGSSVGTRVPAAEGSYELDATRPVPVTNIQFPGRYETIYFEDLQTVGAIMTRSDRNITGLEAKLIEIRAIADRECHQVDKMSVYVVARAKILHGLSQRIKAEILALSQEMDGDDDEEYDNAASGEEDAGERMGN